jgi:hypothetical protein
MTYLLFFGCNASTGCPSFSLRVYEAGFKNEWPSINGKLWDWKAAGVYAAWYAFTVICWNVLPGQQVEGTVLRDGTRKVYNLNGELRSLIVYVFRTQGQRISAEGRNEIGDRGRESKQMMFCRGTQHQIRTDQ